MKRIYIVHCWDGNKSDGWYPWLEEKIKSEDIKVFRFDMPDTTHPKIEEWVEYLSSQVNNLDEDVYFVGHSIGCQTILRYLEKQSAPKIGGALLVAPWLDLLPEAIEDIDSYETAKPWITTPIDFEKIKSKTNNITCIFSSDDYFVSLSEKNKFERLLGAKTIVVDNKGHISKEDGVYELDEIYDELIKILMKE